MTKARDIANAGTALSAVDATELGYLDGVTSNIQTQFGNISGSKAQPTEPASPTDGMIWVDTDGAVTDAQYIAKSLLTTTGDTIYASGANTPARLGIGTTGQVLTVSGGVPAWASPSAPAFVGCSIYNTSAQTLSSGTAAMVAYQAEEFDTDGFHDNTTNNSRITIPTGKGGKYLVIAAVQFVANATGIRAMFIYRNGAIVADNHQHAPTPSASYRGEITALLNLSAGDYLQIGANQQSGGNLDIGAGAENTRFGVVYLGA